MPRQISSDAHPVEHQYILQPVSGEGRVSDNIPSQDSLLFLNLWFQIILNKEWGDEVIRRAIKARQTPDLRTTL